MLREALKEMGRQDLIGNSKQHLIPTYQPQGTEGEYKSARKKNSTVAGDSQKRVTGVRGQGQNQGQNQRPKKGQMLTQHTGLPPRETGEKRPFELTKNKRKGKFKTPH